MAKRISETELILPSLFLMDLNGGAIATSELVVRLREIMKPSGEDLEILAGRNDDKFSQKVRNLSAHRTFDKYGYAKYDENTKLTNITASGIKYLSSKKDILQYLVSNSFDYTDIKTSLQQVQDNNTKQIEVFDENTSIQEGIKKVVETSLYERSSKLRRYAIEYFTNGGHINCKCCSFDFNDFYGEQIGSSYIEIHHTKPIFKYTEDDLVSTLERAISNLIPVCSNCHRMIHKNWSQPLEISTLIENIKQNGRFNTKQTIGL